MTEIRAVLRRAAWRLLALDSLRALAVTVSAALLAFMLTRIVLQVFGLVMSAAEWWRLGLGLAGASLVAALAWSVVRRRNEVGVARELDERADLRESLSTAICVQRSEDPWSRAVVETARERARGVEVKRAIPLGAPRLWPLPLALSLAAPILWHMPRLDVLGWFERDRQAQAQQDEIRTVRAEMNALDQRVREALDRVNAPLEKDKTEAGEAGAPEPSTPEEARRAAIRKLTSALEKLSDARSGDSARLEQSLKQAMRQMKHPGPGPMAELASAMQRGDASKARQELEKLATKLAESSLSPEEKAALEAQLREMGKQMEALSASREALTRALEQAGMSSEDARRAAADPQAMRQMLDNMPGLTAAQRSAVEQAARSMSESGEMMSAMAEALSQMAEGMSPEGLNSQGMEALAQLDRQLSAMEMMAADMQNLDLAMTEAMKQLAKLGEGMGGACKGGECEGTCPGGQCDGNGNMLSPWRQGETDRTGRGSGGPGKGSGAAGPEAEETPIAIDKQKSPTKRGEGPIIGSTFVQGGQVTGESRQAFVEVVEAADKWAAEAFETMRIPREYEDAVKAYYGRLKERVKATPPPTTDEGAEKK